MIIRTHTPLKVERSNGMPGGLLQISGAESPTQIGTLLMLHPGDILRLPGGVPGSELVVEVDLRGVSSSNHQRALVRLETAPANNEEEAEQMRLL